MLGISFMCNVIEKHQTCSGFPACTFTLQFSFMTLTIVPEGCHKLREARLSYVPGIKQLRDKVNQYLGWWYFFFSVYQTKKKKVQ